MEKEIEREVLEVESREKKKKKKRRVWDIWVSVCGAQKTGEKKNETYGWKNGNTITIFL